MAGISDRWADQLAQQTREWFQRPSLDVPDQFPYPITALPEFVCIGVRNDTGADVWQFNVLGLDDPTWQPSTSDKNAQEQFENTDRAEFKGVTPDVSKHIGKWCVLKTGIKSGEIGRAYVSGVVKVRLYVNGADDKYCDVIEGKPDGYYTCYLGTGSSGAQILWRENADSGQGTIVWAIVRLGDGNGLAHLILYDDADPDDTGIQGMPVQADGTADTSADKVTINNKHPGTFRGYGSSHSGFDATTAAKVWCAKDNNGDWQIVCGKGLAKRCKAKAKGIISGSTGTVDNVTVCDDGQCPTASTSDELSISNPWNYYLADNADCELTQSGSSYDITNVVRVSETFDTENQVTGLTLQHKYREIRVNPTGDEHDWETWHTGDDCEA